MPRSLPRYHATTSATSALSAVAAAATTSANGKAASSSSPTSPAAPPPVAPVPSPIQGNVLFGFDMDKRVDRKFVLSIAMKCADVNNPSKPLRHCTQWTAFIMEEFFRQGDEERRRGMDISTLMDRYNTDIPKCQVGFIDFVVAPLFDVWGRFMKDDIKPLVTNIANNKVYWKAKMQEAQAAAAAAAAAATPAAAPPVPKVETLPPSAPSDSRPPLNKGESSRSLANGNGSPAAPHGAASHAASNTASAAILVSKAELGSPSHDVVVPLKTATLARQDGPGV
ncbi:3',5'-cyclic-nucleotide phosphodiesterase [Blastocladiella emersonii ATCC 22665]|nr:3',5'-cyclic-nucleotide phosphodiesterase [Blastocladiella emersonii ATCC 22665]